MEETVLIWDGIEFSNVARSKAETMEKEHKCQILTDGFVDGLALKYRHEFKGYATREMRAAPIHPPRENNPPQADADSEDEVIADYSDNTVVELQAMAEERGLEGYKGLRKADLIDLLEQDDIAKSD